MNILKNTTGTPNDTFISINSTCKVGIHKKHILGLKPLILVQIGQKMGKI